MAALAVVFAITAISGAVAAADDVASSTAARNFTVASPPSPTTTTSGPVTYVFGDSMSDVGNNNYFPTSLAKSNYPWYGIDYPGREATGRFTNGKTIGDYMAEKFGVPPPPPFLSLRMTGKDVLGGVNFASGGAGILNETGVYFVQYLSFDEQISCFEIVKRAMIAKIGKDAAEAAANAALFQIGLGERAAMCMRLYGLGARKVAFNGLPPLGCIPSQRVRSTDGKCLSHVNDYAVQFNAAAKKLLDGLNAKLPGAQMGLADCYSVVMELIEHPEENGFTTAHTSCCNVDTEVGGLCLPNTRPCSDRSAFVFWDAYHTSDAANKVIADRLWADMTSAGHGSASATPHVAASSPDVAPSPSPSQDY
ncbi:GDSL esterase/lipase [Zea mays]|uniref:GDSL esterase/lipase n=1 Tax=Zea mays TaxID=4577 RepID=A0A1D6Q9T2_MAIZE|nr:GDSL esterase/lipase [Zea mays]